MAVTYLFTAQTANASSSGIVMDGRKQGFICRGTWDTATMTIEVSDDGTNYAAQTSMAFTADVFQLMEIPAGWTVRATLSSVGASTSLTVGVM